MTTAPSEAPQTFDPQAFSRDEPDTIFLLTSLTSGSSSIITATSRLEHILTSHKVPFKAADLATDEKARRLWQWKGQGKRLPGIAKNGEVLGNYEDIEDWNEHGELRQNLGLKKKKKRINVMDGTTTHRDPSTTAKPNIVGERPPPSGHPAGGVPTVFSQAGLAAAAAAAGKRKSSGIKSAVGKVEGKKKSSSSKKKAAAEPSVASVAETEEPAKGKKKEAQEPVKEAIKKQPAKEKKKEVQEPVKEAIKEEPAAAVKTETAAEAKIEATEAVSEAPAAVAEKREDKVEQNEEPAKGENVVQTETTTDEPKEDPKEGEPTKEEAKEAAPKEEPTKETPEKTPEQKSVGEESAKEEPVVEEKEKSVTDDVVEEPKEFKASVDELHLEEKKDVAPGDEETKTPTQTPVAELPAVATPEEK